MRRLTRCLVALVALAAVGPVMAADLTRSTAGYTYFNRPGADLDRHDAALELCLSYTYNTRQPETPVTGGAGMGLIGAAVEGLIVGTINATGRERGLATNVENCMVASGWRVVRLPESEGRALYDQPPSVIREWLAPLVGADQPGEIARRFENDITDPTTRWLATTGDLDKVSLSLKAFDFRKWIEKTRKEVAAQAKAAGRVAAPKPKFKPPKGRSPFTRGEWTSIKAEDTVVVARTIRTKTAMAPVLLFVRLGPDPNINAWMQDGEIDVFRIGMPVDVRDGQGEDWFVMTMPPGKWRFVGVQAGSIIFSFCLGGPTFELEPGQALFLGTFGSGTSPQIAPNLDLSPVATAFADLPNLRERIIPAPWRNGERFACDGTYIYALETPGAPFLAGYDLGSRAGPFSKPAQAESGPEATPPAVTEPSAPR